MPRKKTPTSSRKPTTKSKSNRKSTFRGGRTLEVIIAAVFGLVVLYVVSMSIRVSRGVSRTIDEPEHEVRLQVLNGCAVNGLAARVADTWSDYIDSDLHVVVVDADNFDLHNVAESFIISRQENRIAARLLAERVGLNPDQVVFKPLENNYRDVTATLVLGTDWPEVEAAQHEKE